MQVCYPSPKVVLMAFESHNEILENVRGIVVLLLGHVVDKPNLS